MKTFLMTLVLSIFLATTVFAVKPLFLVCDPVENVTNYVVRDNGMETNSVPQDLGDGTVRLHYDLGGITIGEHHFEVAAENEWGRSEFAIWDCNKIIPGAPTGLRIEK